MTRFQVRLAHWLTDQSVRKYLQPECGARISRARLTLRRKDIPQEFCGCHPLAPIRPRFCSRCSRCFPSSLRGFGGQDHVFGGPSRLFSLRHVRNSDLFSARGLRCFPAQGFSFDWGCPGRGRARGVRAEFGPAWQIRILSYQPTGSAGTQSVFWNRQLLQRGIADRERRKVQRQRIDRCSPHAAIRDARSRHQSQQWTLSGRHDQRPRTVRERPDHRCDAGCCARDRHVGVGACHDRTRIAARQLRRAHSIFDSQPGDVSPTIRPTRSGRAGRQRRSAQEEIQFCSTLHVRRTRDRRCHRAHEE